jgi:hypothetical protein
LSLKAFLPAASATIATILGDLLDIVSSVIRWPARRTQQVFSTTDQAAQNKPELF